MKKAMFILLAVAMVLTSCQQGKSLAKADDFQGYQYLVYDDNTGVVYWTNEVKKLDNGRLEFVDKYNESISCLDCTLVARGQNSASNGK